MNKKDTIGIILLLAAVSGITAALLWGVDACLLGSGCAAVFAVCIHYLEESSKTKQKTESEKRKV